MTKKTVLIVGATGNQGGAVVAELLKKNEGKWRIVAMTRNGASERSDQLRAQGVEIVQADLNDHESLEKGLAKVSGAGGMIDGVFCVTNYWAKGVGAKEVTQAQNLINAVERHGKVRVFVYSSCACADPRQRPGHASLVDFDTRWEVEKYLHEHRTVPSVILRPVQFAENFFGWLPDTHVASEKSIGWPGFDVSSDTKHAFVTASDYGKMVIRVFDSPDEFIGKTLDVVSFNMTAKEILASYERVVKHPVKPGTKISMWVLFIFANSAYKLFRFFNKLGFQITDSKFAEISKYMPKTTSWEQFLQQRSK